MQFMFEVLIKIFSKIDGTRRIGKDKICINCLTIDFVP
jgi:hypothetical protein